MTSTLEYGDVSSEIRGVLTPGRLKLTDQHIIFKNAKTGKVEQIAAEDIDLINSQKFVGTWGIRVFTKNGTLHRFVGFKDSENEKLAGFIKQNYGQSLVEKEMCVKGWNWGTARFKGSVLSFDRSKDNKSIFEVPLAYVSQCMTGKNEVTLEFHQNDDAPVGLMEMRFHIPAIESAADDDPVETFQQNVVAKASVISAAGDAIAIFREVHILTPRGRYDIKVFATFFQLHGKTFDYKVPMESVLRLFLLPHKDGRQMFFVLSLDPPIKQGQTRYHYLVLLFPNDEETSTDLALTESELKQKYDGKLEKTLSGPVYEVIGKLMKVLIGRKITGPGSFLGHSGTPAIACSYKAAAGYLYPLERGFIFIHKPPIHVRFEEISSVNFARNSGTGRTFDFEIALKNGTVQNFSSMEKEEYPKLYNFVTQKKLHVSTLGKEKNGHAAVDFSDSDNEQAPDIYLARVQAEAREKDDDGSDEDDDDESTDEDFNPNKEHVSDVAEEYDSDVQNDSDDSDDSDASGSPKERSEHKQHKPKKAKEAKKERVKKQTKKKKDANKPKRATTAFMLWLNEQREEIKRDNPGIKVTEIAKKAGEMWKDLKDKSKWEELANKDKQRYADEMRDYKPTATADESQPTSTSSKKRKLEASPHKKSSAGSSGQYKSKEYISDDDSSTTSESKKKKKDDSVAKEDVKEEEEEEEEESAADTENEEETSD